MASNLIEILLEARDEASEKLKAVSGAIEENGKDFKEAGKIITAAGVAISGAIALTVKAAADAERVWSAVSMQIENVGYSSKEVIPLIRQFSTEIQRTTGVNDELVAQIVGRMAPATKDLRTAFDAAKATLDLAATGFVDVEAAGRLVAQAMDGNVAALRRYVPGLRQLTDQQLDNMTAAERQQLALKAIQDVFGGLADRQGKTLQGRLEALQSAFGDLMEVVGEQLLPVITAATDVLVKITMAAKRAAEEHPILTKVLVALAAAYGGLALVIGPLLFLLPAVNVQLAATWALLSPFAPVILGVAAAIGAVVTAFTLWGDKLDQIGAKLKNFVNLIPPWLRPGGGIGAQAAGLIAGLGPGTAQAQPGGIPGPLAGPGQGGMAGGPAGAPIISDTQVGDFETKIDQIKRKSTEAQEEVDRFSQFLVSRLGEGWNTLGGAVENLSLKMAETFQVGMGQAITSVIMGTESAGEAFKALGTKMIEVVVSYLAELAVAKTVGALFMKASTVASLAMASALAAAWAPVAALVSLATFGTNAGPAAAAVTGVNALASGLAKATASFGGAQLAEGGIVTAPTFAMIGERRRKEAVIPLDDPKAMGMLAGLLGGGGGGISVTVNNPSVRDDRDIDELARRVGHQLGFQLELQRRRPRTAT